MKENKKQYNVVGYCRVGRKEQLTENSQYQDCKMLVEDTKKSMLAVRRVG